LLLDKEPFQYQKTMSDAAGLDPRAHGNDPEKLIACIRDFLAVKLHFPDLLGFTPRLGFDRKDAHAGRSHDRLCPPRPQCRAALRTELLHLIQDLRDLALHVALL
jgi:hypothetical protein